MLPFFYLLEFFLIFETLPNFKKESLHIFISNSLLSAKK